jgi:hypothetical protein
MIAVLDPLPDVAMHVVEPERIRLFLADRMCLAAGVLDVPGIFAKR